jgi:predicted PurR-regulated permease PerM
MATALGLIGLVGFIVGVILLACAVTWTVVKITPQRDRAEQSS